MATLQTTTVEVLGPAQIFTGAVASEVSVGHTTKDGIEFTYKPDWGDPVVVDQFGNTPIDYRLIGEMAEIKAILAQFESDVLTKLIPAGTAASGGSPPFTAGGEVGLSAASIAERLVVRPFRNSTGPDRSQDIVLYKAFCMSAVPIQAKFKSQVQMEVTFVGLLDTSRPDGNRLWGIGDDEL